jgi:hypoxanthine phosphoribosyltransferase
MSIDVFRSPRPSLFVGSSSEGLNIASALQVALDYECEVELWTQGVFGLTKGSLESLVNSLTRFDFAVLALTPDDLTLSRGIKKPSARDNVLFELGLFIGALGRERTFILCDRTKAIPFPSDLAGVTPVTYEPHSSGNEVSSLGAACTLIKNAIHKLGPRNSKSGLTISSAPAFTFDEIKQMVANIHRRIETEFRPDIIVTMSGPGSIAAHYLSQLNTRSTPLFVAIAFPKSRSGKVSMSIKRFRAVSKVNGWRELATDKWSIFLPGLLFGFPVGTKVVIFDDRVLSGASQIVLYEALRACKYEVRRAAVVSCSDQAGAVHWHGRIVDGTYYMPWGTHYGRY